MKSVIQVAEADGEVGLGHLRELHAIGAVFEQRGITTQTYVLGKPLPDAKWGDIHWIANSEMLTSLLWKMDAAASVWNFRRSLDANLERLFDRLGRIRVWITDQPGEPLPAEIVVIPAVVQSHFQKRGRLLEGFDYLPLDTPYAEPPLPVAERSHEVLLSLGGADRTRATLRLLGAIAEFNSTVVIGPGFAHADTVKGTANELGIRFVHSPDGLQQLLRMHRIVVTAGGNTLAEAAASGTPAVVTWEDSHERNQGELFERMGAAVVVGKGDTVDPDLLHWKLKRLLACMEQLTEMASAGRRIADGRGADRIVDAVLEEIGK